ncbi:hypothetical protein BD779DRAFT_1473151 [Infundibulicybe gibba]|nr:hypothetical protein BD779DRAFT_1473151 [Infundibulicybe gibba]
MALSRSPLNFMPLSGGPITKKEKSGMRLTHAPQRRTVNEPSSGRVEPVAWNLDGGRLSNGRYEIANGNWTLAPQSNLSSNTYQIFFYGNGNGSKIHTTLTGTHTSEIIRPIGQSVRNKERTKLEIPSLQGNCATDKRSLAQMRPGDPEQDLADMEIALVRMSFNQDKQPEKAPIKSLDPPTKKLEQKAPDSRPTHSAV